MAGLRSRNKGKVGERELAKLFEDNGFPAERGQQFRGGPDSPDVLVKSLPWLHIESKRAETFSIYGSLQQASADASVGQLPTVFHRRNHKPWVVLMPVEAFFELVKRAEGGPVADRGQAD